MADRPKGVVPHLVVAGAKDALAFYEKAFAAQIITTIPADDGKRLLHAEMRVNESTIFLCDDFPEYRGGKSSTPLALGGSSVTLHQTANDVDAAIERAVAAGGKVAMPAQDMFWGDRYGQVKDPFGHVWSFGGPMKGDKKA